MNITYKPNEIKRVREMLDDRGIEPSDGNVHMVLHRVRAAFEQQLEDEVEHMLQEDEALI